jgi:citronellol/citronellal dehydrogenase
MIAGTPAVNDCGIRRTMNRPRNSALFAPDLLKDQVWLVSGGGTGIGFATAELAASLGAKTVLASRKESSLAPAVETINERFGGCRYLTCDIREPEQVSALVDSILGEEGQVDVLVNNAGGQFPTPAQGLSIKGWDTVIRNNLSGTWYMTQTVATRAMIPRRRGAIVNIIANIYRGFPGMVHTGAARAGVDNLTKTLAVEWAPHGIRINAVAPGIIESSGLKQYPPPLIAQCRSAIPFKRMGQVDEVAAPIVFLASAGASYISGTTLYIDGCSRLWGDLWPIPDPPEWTAKVS